MKKIYYLIAMAFMALTFTSCEDVPEPYGQPVSPKKAVVDPEGSGSVSDPYNVAGAIAKCKEIGDAVSSEKFYVKGYAATEGKADADYGNASFYLSDFKDGSGKRFYAYQVTGSDGQKMKDGYTIKIGDEVVIYGPMYNYNNKTPETASKGAAYIVTVNGQKTENSGGDAPAGDAKGTGTQSDPFNVAAAIAKCKEIGTTESTEKYYVKGKVVADATPAANYGNVTFKMVDEDGGAQFTAFQVMGSDGKKMPASYKIPKGAEVVVYGPIYNYSGNTPETAGKGAAYIVTVNGQKTEVEGGESGGGGDVTPGTPKGTGTEADPFNVAAAVAKCKEVGTTASTESYYIKGITAAEYTVDSYKNVTVDIVDTDGATEKFTVYRVKDKDGKGIKEGYKIAKGATIIVYGPIMNYKGNTPETATGAYLVSVNGQAPVVDDGTSGGGNEGGGGTSGGDTGDISAAFGDLDCSNLASIKLSDGTTLSVAQEDGKSAPVYHEGTKIIRIYARNSITINAGSKKISKVVLEYDTYNGTAYKGNDEMYGEAGTNKITPTKDDANITFANVNNSTLKVVNWLESGNSGGTQLRIKKITITYAK